MERDLPRQRQPARLVAEKDRFRKDGSLLQRGSWIILDGGQKTRTGCGIGDRAGAEKALQAYLVAQHTDKPIAKGKAAAEVSVADVIRHYAEAKSSGDDVVADVDELGRRLGNLLDFWGSMTLDDIDSATCKRYASHRGKPGSARRELQDLKAAVNLALADKICREAVRVSVPKGGKSRKGFIDRDVAARLIWHAYRKHETQTVHRGPRKGQKIVTSRRPTRHLARFIIFALYTGTRSKRVWSASFYKEEGRPWIDVDAGVYYREAPGESAAANKRAPSIRLPDRLVAHLRRWRDGGHDPKRATRYLCEFRGRVGDTKKAFAKLIKDVLGEEGDDIVRHSLRHTAATWLLQSAEDPHAVAGYLGMRTDTLISVYGHHHPDYQQSIGEAFTKGRAGRTKKPGKVDSRKRETVVEDA